MELDILGHKRVACEAMAAVAKETGLGHALMKFMPGNHHSCFPHYPRGGSVEIRFYPERNFNRKGHWSIASVSVNVEDQTAEVKVPNVYDIIRSSHLKYYDDSPGGEHEHLANGIHMALDVQKAIERAINLKDVPPKKLPPEIPIGPPRVHRALR